MIPVMNTSSVAASAAYLLENLFWVAVAFVSAVVVHLAVLYITRKQPKPQQPSFPFLKLPAELRECIYEHLITDTNPTYPARTAFPTKTPTSTLSTLKSHVWGPHSLFHSTPPKTPNCMGALLSSKQIYMELSAVLHKKRTYTLYVDENNASSPSLWTISQHTLTNLRACALRLKVTASMIGAVDPRIAPANWEIRDRLFEIISQKNMPNLTHLSLHIEAQGYQHWNPVWLWHYTSQAFKTSELKAFRTVAFALPPDLGWGRSENYMARSDEGEGWEWKCPEGHFAAADRVEMPVREFCGALMAGCAGACVVEG